MNTQRMAQEQVGSIEIILLIVEENDQGIRMTMTDDAAGGRSIVSENESTESATVVIVTV